MNKRLLLILLAAYSSIAFADETVILLSGYTMNGKKIGSETVIAGSDSILVNSEKLAPSQVIAQAGLIKKISEFKTSSSIKTCEAGRFEHILKKGKLVKKETGCLESERYQELKASFKALAKDPVLN